MPQREGDFLYPRVRISWDPGTSLAPRLGDLQVQGLKIQSARSGREDSEVPTRTPGKPPVAPSGRPAESWEAAARPEREQSPFILSFIHTVHEAILKLPVNKPAKSRRCQ